MLVLQRTQGSFVVIDGRLVVRILRVTGNRVRFGLEGRARFVRSEIATVAGGGERDGHLILSRKANQGIDIVGLGTVKVLSVSGRRVRLGFDGFPREVQIDRGERAAGSA